MPIVLLVKQVVLRIARETGGTVISIIKEMIDDLKKSRGA